MILGIDKDGVVRMVSSSMKVSDMPTTFNGLVLTARLLSRQEKEAFEALPADRSGTILDGSIFTPLPAEVPTKTKVLTVDALAAALTKKGLITAQDVDAAKG